MYLQAGMVIEGEFKKSPYVIRTSDMASIPFDEGNADYVEFLAWLDAGNVPEEIDLLTAHYPDPQS